MVRYSAVEQRSAREAHNLEVPGSTPGCATKFNNMGVGNNKFLKQFKKVYSYYKDGYGYVIVSGKKKKKKKKSN